MPKKATAKRLSFAEWKIQLDAVAAEEGLVPMESPPQHETEIWIKHYNAGRSPRDADRKSVV